MDIVEPTDKTVDAIMKVRSICWGRCPNKSRLVNNF
jgi:hypothetical protein